MAGWKCAAAPEIRVAHDANSTNDPASIERVNRGVVNWVNKWNRYFNGKNYHYHHPNVTRFGGLGSKCPQYLEEVLEQLRYSGSSNRQPTTALLDGREYDLIRVPRMKGFYRGSDYFLMPLGELLCSTVGSLMGGAWFRIPPLAGSSPHRQSAAHCRDVCLRSP